LTYKLRQYVYLCMTKQSLYKNREPEDFSFQVAESAVAYNLVQSFSQGLPFHFFQKLSGLFPLSFREWATVLGISERTLQRYEKSKKKFDGLHAEQLVRISMLNNLGLDVFGKAENWQYWLSQPSPAFGGLVPKTLLGSFTGQELIRDELNRINHGIFS
jgi:putative toxin-antitoxin system antitoxin component (TIGR02293 family)